MKNEMIEKMIEEMIDEKVLDEIIMDVEKGGSIDKVTEVVNKLIQGKIDKRKAEESKYNKKFLIGFKYTIRGFKGKNFEELTMEYQRENNDYSEYGEAFFASISELSEELRNRSFINYEVVSGFDLECKVMLPQIIDSKQISKNKIKILQNKFAEYLIKKLDVQLVSLKEEDILWNSGIEMFRKPRSGMFYNEILQGDVYGKEFIQAYIDFENAMDEMGLEYNFTLSNK